MVEYVEPTGMNGIKAEPVGEIAPGTPVPPPALGAAAEVPSKAEGPSLETKDAGEGGIWSKSRVLR
jgi:hypothetical protein